MVASSIAAVTGIEKTSALFRRLLAEMADRLDTNPDYIAAVMSVESGFDAQARNPNGGATGLIQFMPSTAKRLGTTTDALFQMTEEEQLPWVEKYFAPFVGRLNTATDVYMTVFFPAHAGRSADNIIASSGSQVYELNKGLDHNHDGHITNGDVGATVEARLAAAANRPRIPVEGGSVTDDSPLSRQGSPPSGSGQGSSSESTSPGAVDEAALARIIPSINIDPED